MKKNDFWLVATLLVAASGYAESKDSLKVENVMSVRKSRTGNNYRIGQPSYGRNRRKERQSKFPFMSAK